MPFVCWGQPCFAMCFVSILIFKCLYESRLFSVNTLTDSCRVLARNFWERGWAGPRHTDMCSGVEVDFVL